MKYFFLKTNFIQDNDAIYFKTQYFKISSFLPFGHNFQKPFLAQSIL
jgi:hypothetical protein